MKNKGFTLFEVLVVVVIIAISSVMILPNLMPTEKNRMEEEAQRLSLLMDAIRQEAILKFQNFAFQVYPDHYRFLKLEPGSDPKPMSEDKLFKTRIMPEDITIRIDKEKNQVVSLNAFSSSKEDEQEEEVEEGEKPPEPLLNVLVLATGEMTPFSIQFVNLEGQKLILEGNFSGKMTLLDDKEEFFK